MTTTPTLNGQVLGQAANATRAVLDRTLAGSGITFRQSVVLNAAASAGGTIDREELADRMVAGLKIDATAAHEAIDQVASTELGSADDARFSLTTAGRERHEQITGAIAGITQRLYGDLPAEDLATAGRVLTLVTARANAELAGS